MDQSPKTVVQLRGAADLLGMLPHRIGFLPAESIVVVCLHGPRRRDGLVMRLDLAPSRLDGPVACHLAARAARAGADGVVLVCYAEAAGKVPMAPDLPRRSLVDALAEALDEVGVEVVDAILVSGGRWWSYVCGDATCCPREGSEVPQRLTAAAAHYAAESVAQGSAVLADRNELVRSVRPPEDAAAQQTLQQALDTAADEVIEIIDRSGLAGLRARTLALLRDLVHRRSFGREDVTGEEAAAIILGLRAKDARDEAATLLLDHDPELMLPVLVAVARRAPDREAAPVCTVLAWVAYAAGQGALANVAVDRALECEPGYEMARLIEQGLESMIRPAEVRRLTQDVRDALAGD
jgi:uncharacterized protein DUF4192